MYTCYANLLIYEYNINIYICTPELLSGIWFGLAVGLRLGLGFFTSSSGSGLTTQVSSMLGPGLGLGLAHMQIGLVLGNGPQKGKTSVTCKSPKCGWRHPPCAPRAVHDLPHVGRGH